MSHAVSVPSAVTPQGPYQSESYVTQTAELLGLSISPEQLASVVENFERVCAIAQPVLDFPLPDDLEAGPRFEP